MSLARWVPGVLLAVWALPPATLQGQERLSAGTVLVYRTEGRADQRWLVEGVETGLSHGGRAGCIRVRFAPGGPRTDAEIRFTCVSGDTVMTWSEGEQAWRPSRPIAAGDSLEIRGSRGVTLFSTGGLAVDTVSGEAVPVIATTVLTFDAQGGRSTHPRAPVGVPRWSSGWSRSSARSSPGGPERHGARC